MFKKIIVLSFLSGLAFSQNIKLEEIAAKLSKDYAANLDLNREHFNLIQTVQVANCQVKIETKKDFGVIARDSYDLSRLNVFKRIIGFKGTKVIAFGLKSIFLHRTFLHFNNAGERDAAYHLFRDYSHLCKKKTIRGTLVEEKELVTTNFVGRLPEDQEVHAGKVFSQGVALSLLRHENSFIERLKAVRKARKTIYMEQLFIRGDEAGMLFAEEIIKKRMEGVDVKVIVTALFNIISNKDFKVDMQNSAVVLRNMMAAGIRIHGFGCKGYMDNEIRGLDVMKILRPSHVKNWIIDGEDYSLDSAISISGGLNVSSRYFLLGKRMQWLDQDIGAKGPIVSEMHEAFLRNFYDREIHYETYRDDDTCLNPFDPISQKEAYLKFKNEKTKPYKAPSGAEVLAEKEYIRKNISKILNGESIFGGKMVPVKWIEVQGARYILQRPDEGEEFILKTYVDLVNSAQKEILISNVFALFVPEMKLALRRAAARGVKIHILTNDPTNDKGNPLVNTVSRYYYRDLVYANHPDLDEEFDPSLKYSPDQITFSEWNGRLEGETNPEKHIVMHSKYMVVDRIVGVVGSYNMDYASLLNLEQIVIYESPELASDLAKLFEQDLKYSQQVSLEKIDSFKSPKGSRLLLFLGKILESRL